MTGFEATGRIRPDGGADVELAIECGSGRPNADEGRGRWFDWCSLEIPVSWLRRNPSRVIGIACCIQRASVALCVCPIQSRTTESAVRYACRPTLENGLVRGGW